MKIADASVSAQFDHSVLAEVISRRWRENRAFFSPGTTTRVPRLEDSWWREPANTALELHWSRGRPSATSAQLPPSSQEEFLAGSV
jgi:hypothetical protein